MCIRVLLLYVSKITHTYFLLGLDNVYFLSTHGSSLICLPFPSPHHFVVFCQIYSPLTRKRCIAMFWTVSPHSLGSCHFRVICLPHKGGAQSRSTPTSGPPKVSARAPAHRSYHFRGVKLKTCIKKIHHNLYISKQANVRIKHADTEGASHKKFGTDARVQ